MRVKLGIEKGLTSSSSKGFGSARRAIGEWRPQVSSSNHTIHFQLPQQVIENTSHTQGITRSNFSHGDLDFKLQFSHKGGSDTNCWIFTLWVLPNYFKP